MPESNYAALDAPEAQATGGGQAEDTTEETTALIPKTLLGGKPFKVGDEVVFKIVHEYEDEVEVSYAKEPPEEKEPASPSADQEIDQMAAGPPEMSMPA